MPEFQVTYQRNGTVCLEMRPELAALVSRVLQGEQLGNSDEEAKVDAAGAALCKDCLPR